MFKLSKLIGKCNTRQSSNKDYDVPHLLVSNLPPTDDEEITIRKGLVEAQNSEKKLESQLRSLDLPTPSSSKSQVNWFNQAVSCLQAAREATLSHTSALSSHRRLPPEVLILIFTFANDPYVLDSWDRRPCVSSFRVSQVCRTWRNIAVNTPDLWTTVDLILDNGATAVTSKRFTSTLKERARGKRSIKSTAYCDFTAELLRRSQEKDLNVYVYARYYGYDYMNDHPILLLLAPHLWRCSSLTVESMILTVVTIFESSGWSGLLLGHSTDINDLVIPRASRLQALKLDLFDWNEATRKNVILYQELPLLKHVELVGIRSESIRSLPWAQLHTFKQSSESPSFAVPRIHTLIPASPHLRTLKLAYQNYESVELLVPTATSTTQLETPEITSLELHISPDDAPTFGILTHINFASLLELRVGAFPGDLLKEIIFVVTCLHPIGQLSLTKVAFRSEQLESGLLERFLQLTPCLEELDIALPPPDADNLECLVSKRLVPRLAILTIHASSANEISAAQGALCVIGASRFALRQQDTSGYQPTATVKKFRITLSSLDDACNALMTLNMWHFKPTESQPFLRIAEWRLELNPLVDVVTREDIPKKDRSQVARKLHDLMLEIESLRLSSGQDIANLFRSKILDPLTSLCGAKDTHFVLYYARNHAFATRAEKLLQTWKMDICGHFLESDTNAPFMFESSRILAYHGSMAELSDISTILECLRMRSIDNFFETKDDLTRVHWENYMYS